MVKILEHPENQKFAMMDSSHERQSVGSFTGVCNGAGEPGTASAERVPGGGEPSPPGTPASPAAPVGSGAMHAGRDRQTTRAKALEKVAWAAQPNILLAWYRRLIARQLDGSQCRIHPGRPRISAEVEELVVRFARENSGWGYDLSFAKMRPQA